MGTSLINAYRRCPDLKSPDRACVVRVLDKATDVLQQLKKERLANTHTYSCVMGMYAQVGCSSRQQ